MSDEGLPTDHFPSPRGSGLRSLGLETLDQRERRLARLEDLLQQLGQQRRESPGRAGAGPPPADGARRRRGFSLIELLVVLSVIVVLIAISLPTFSDSLRRGAVRDAAAAILGTAEQARQLSLQANGIDDVRYGVRLADGGSEPAHVVLLKHEDGTTEVLRNGLGEPVSSIEIPDSVVIWQGGSDLRSQSEGELEWWYTNGSGRVRIMDGGSLSNDSVAIGLPTRFVDSAWGLPANSGTPLALAQADGDEPGLSVRDTGNSFAIALGVYPSGLAFSNEIERER